MAKRVWVSLPLTTTSDLADATVVGFLKGGKKTLEIETGAFITKWLVDKGVPFTIEFESSNLDRNLVTQTLPGPLQKSLGNPADAASVPQTEPPTPIENLAAEVPPMVELAPAEIPAAEHAITAEPAPVELPAVESVTSAEPAPIDAPADETTTLTEPVPVETPTAEPSAEPAAPAATGEPAVPEEQESGSKRASRLRVKRPKAGPSEVA
jgi:hypothetical protein